MQRPANAASLLLLLVVCSPGLVVRGAKSEEKSTPKLIATYSGDTSVKEHHPWSIACTVPDPSEKFKPDWKKDGSRLNSEEFSTGSMIVKNEYINGVSTSTLSAQSMAVEHVGVYKCVGGTSSHTLNIIHDVTTKVLVQNDTISLSCPEGVMNPKWKRGNNSVETNAQFVLNGDGTTLEIVSTPENKADTILYTDYSCIGDDKLNGTVVSKYRVVKKPNVLMSPDTIVIEGEKLHLTCSAKEYEPGLMILWTFKEKNYTRDDLSDRITLTKDEEKNIPNAVFHLSDVTKEDRGNIICVAYYNYEDIQYIRYTDSATTSVRVKDKLAALWPFLGICAEVVILCAIILIYEKKRNKSELEESDTDQSPDTKPTPNKDSDVRHRK